MTAAKPHLLFLVVAVWLLQTIVGLSLMTGPMHLGPAGLAMHFSLVALVLAAILLPHAAGWLSRMPEKVRTGLLALALSMAQTIFLVFYAAASISLSAWGDLVTLSMIKGYLLQLRYLPDAHVAGIVLAGLLIGLVWLLLLVFYLRMAPGLLGAMARSSGLMFGISRLAFGLLAIVLAISLAYAADAPAWRLQEPMHGLRGVGLYAHAAPPGLFLTPRPDYEAMHAGEVREPIASRRPLVLISVDALRSDYMQVYGYPEQNTPFLDALQRQGRLQRFDNTYALCVKSFCGLLGLLSSQYWHQLNHPPENLADLLKRHGYRNYFVLSGDHTNFYGLKALYGPNLDFYLDGSQIDRIKPYSANDDRFVIRWLSGFTYHPGDPVFLYFHLMGVHQIGVRSPEYHLHKPDDVITISSKEALDDPSRLARLTARYRNNYLNGIRQTDARISQIFTLLERKGILKDALVVITADHGEHVGERVGDHVAFGHEGVPDEALSRIPLLVHDPVNPRYPRRNLVSQVDIAPTMLASLGVAAPANWSGIPLQQPARRRVIAVASHEASGIIVDEGARGRVRYLRDQRDGSESLVHLQDDPAQERASWPAAQHELQEMRASHRAVSGKVGADMLLGQSLFQ